EAELAASRARLDAVIRSALDPIIVLDADRRVTLFNPAAEAVFGCPAAEAVGTDVSRFLPSVRVPGSGSRDPEPGTPLELEGRRADGTPVPLEVSASSAEVAGQAVHTLILRDVSERRRVLAEIQAKS